MIINNKRKQQRYNKKKLLILEGKKQPNQGFGFTFMAQQKELQDHFKFLILTNTGLKTQDLPNFRAFLFFYDQRVLVAPTCCLVWQDQLYSVSSNQLLQYAIANP